MEQGGAKHTEKAILVGRRRGLHLWIFMAGRWRMTSVYGRQLVVWCCFFIIGFDRVECILINRRCGSGSEGCLLKSAKVRKWGSEWECALRVFAWSMDCLMCSRSS